jgi:hypothetical protein
MDSLPELDERAQAGNAKTEPVEGKPVEVDYRIFINGFPKSGTHLVEQMIRTIAPPMRAQKPWAGSFAGNSWTETWIEDFRLFRQLGWLNDGAYAKGHLGHRYAIEMFIWGCGATMLFAYRDPRDVAISQVHHILFKGQHPEKEPYQKVYEAQGFKAVLKMVIEGYQGEERNNATMEPMYYSGVIARWRHYAPWMVIPWVMSMRFEDMIHRREAVAEAIVNVAVTRAALHRGYVATIPDDVKEAAVKRMVAATYKTDKSPTFRKGTDKQWIEHFDDEIKELWKQHDPPAPLPENIVEVARRYNQHDILAEAEEPKSWLVRLGYEESEAW